MLKRSMVLLTGGATLFLGACSAGPAPEANESAATQKTSSGANGEPLRAGLYHVVQTGDVDIEEERCFPASDVAAGRFPVAGSTGEGWTIDTNRMSGGTIEVAAPPGALCPLCVFVWVSIFPPSRLCVRQIKSRIHRHNNGAGGFHACQQPCGGIRSPT